MKTVIIIWATVSVGFILGWVARKKICENQPPEPEPEKNPWKHVAEVSFNSKTIKGKIMSTTAQVKQKFTLTWPAPVDKYGNPAQVEDVRFVSDDEEFQTIEAAPEVSPYSAHVTTGTKTGGSAVRIKGDGDLGDGVKEIEGVHVVEIIGGDAVGFGDPTATVPEDVEDEELPESPDEEVGEGEGEETLP